MKRRDTYVLLIKLVFAVAVLVWLFREVEFSSVLRNLQSANKACILIAFLLSLLTIGIAGWRWQRILRIFEIKIPLKSLILVAQIGQFFAMFLPGPAGDDLTRMIYVSRIASGRAGEACTSVFIDRLIGFASVLMLAVLCVPFQWDLLATSRQTFWLGTGIIAVGVGVCLFGAGFFFAGQPTHEWFQRGMGRLPAHKLKDELLRIWGLLCTNKKSLAQVIAGAIATQLILCLVFHLAGMAVGIDASPLVWFGFVPVVLAANALPITVAGIGVREYLLVLFLGVLAGVDREQALAASFVVFTIMLAVCLMGGVVYILYRSSRAAGAQKPPISQ